MTYRVSRFRFAMFGVALMVAAAMVSGLGGSALARGGPPPTIPPTTVALPPTTLPPTTLPPPTTTLPALLPDLVVGIVANPPVVQPGAGFVYAVTVSNTGSADAGAFSVYFPSIWAATGAGWTCVSGPQTRASAARTLCQTTGLAAGASSVISVPQTAPGGKGTYTTLSAFADNPLFVGVATGAVLESNENNNTATGSFTVPVDGPWDFSAVHGPALASVGFPTLPSEPVTFSTTIANLGLHPGSTPVTFTDTLPIGFTMLSWSASVSTFDPVTGLTSTASPGSVSCTPTGSPTTGLVITCTGVPNIGPPGTTPFGGSVNIIAQPPAGVLVNYDALDTVVVNSDGAIPEPNTANNTSNGAVHISDMLPDLAVGMTTSPDPVAPGSVITNDITITNAGTANAPSASLRFGLLAGPFIDGGGNGVTCFTAVVGRSGTRITTCSAANLAAGASVSFPVHLQASGLVGTTSTTANVYVGVVREVPAGADNFASTTTTVGTNGGVDLTVDVVGPVTVPVGLPMSFTLTVRNTGIGVASATTVENTLPVGFAFLAGAGNDGSCSVSGQVVSCPIGAMAPRSVQSISISATAPSIGAISTDSAVIDPSNVVVESDESNNTSSAAIRVSAAYPDLTTSISGPATTPRNGNPAFIVTVTNTGNTTATTTGLTVDLAGFARIDSVVAPLGWSCSVRKSPPGNYVDCFGGPVDAATTITVQITAAGANSQGPTTVTANVDPGNAVQELSEANNTASFTINVN